MPGLILLLLCFAQLLALASSAEMGDRCHARRGRFGICTPIRQCQTAIDEIRRGGQPPVHCGFRNRVPIVCCPEHGSSPSLPVTTAPPTAPPTQQKAGMKATKRGICRDSQRRTGVCTAIDLCPSAQADLRSGLRPMTCGFERNQPIVCYSPGDMSTTLTPTPRKPGDRAQFWCKKYSEPCPKIFAVAGGTPALPDEFPHMAAVGYGPRSNIKWKCGGSLISENFILTAAHCLRGGRDGPAQWVLLGTVTLATNESSLDRTGQIHEVVRRVRHPGYKPPAKYDDVALLQIGPAITKNPKSVLTKALHPACLKTDESTRFPHIATGWGRVGFGEAPSMELLKVELDVFDEAKCNKTFDTEIRTTNQLTRGIDSTMLCAGVLRGGKDTCQGDSGGPFQVPTSRTCQYEIWGITSFGKICSFANSPSVYMKVSAYVEWIESIVWP